MIGEHHWNAALTVEKVREIRAAHQKRVVTYADLAERFGTTEGNIAKVVRREHWKDA